MGAERGPAERAVVTLAWEVPTGAPADALDTVDHVTAIANSITGDELFRGPLPRDARTDKLGGLITFTAPPGAVNVKVTAENARGVRIDTSEASVDVPDFTITGPQLTTPFVYRGRTARDLQQIRAAATPTPSITPVFSRAERLLIRFGAYGPGGTMPAVTLRLLNREGHSLADLPAPTRVSGNELESELGLGSFPPGDYIVEIAATVGSETTKRLVGIRVTG
jgi:hypothetical protein